MSVWRAGQPCTPRWVNRRGWPSSTCWCSARRPRPSCNGCWRCRRTSSPTTCECWNRAGVIARHRSEGGRRRTYLTLAPGALEALRPTTVRDAVRVVFVRTQNSARSQLAAVLRSTESTVPVASAGTHRPPPCIPERSPWHSAGGFPSFRRHPGTSTRSCAPTTWSSPSATQPMRNSAPVPAGCGLLRVFARLTCIRSFPCSPASAAARGRSRVSEGSTAPGTTNRLVRCSSAEP